ncbi:MAG: rhodoquinone biosynthesis methyltransferase RquA [Lysobacterales bacterium]|jgi:ubiquinone/menaquinone biosynthesis C-methylase UbiE
MENVGSSTRQARTAQTAVTPGASAAEAPVSLHVVADKPQIPAYLQDTYYWAYINPRNVRLLDREIVVRTILWQQHNRLQQLAFAEIGEGQSVLQPAAVYGSFSANLAQHVGPRGSLDVIDVAEIQVVNTRRKLKDFPQATVHHANALQLGSKPYDVVCCYFLLHEIPDEEKFAAVNLFLSKLKPGGKAVFVDYHKPRWWHPLKPITSLVFDTLEPYAKGLWRREIQDFADNPESYSWRKETIFGTLFQKVVATKVEP